jgi:phage baseplate assembly protein W
MPTTSTSIFGVIPAKAANRTSKSQNKFLRGIGYPLAKSRTKRVFGDIKAVENVNYFTQTVDKELITGMLRQLFLTKKGERIMNPSFGLDLKHFVFTPLDLTTFELIRTNILNQIREFVPFIEVIKLNIFELPPSLGDNGLIVNLTLKIKNVNTIDPFEVEVNLG